MKARTKQLLLAYGKYSIYFALIILIVCMQAFIATPNSVNDFLDSYENVRYTTVERYYLVHVVALPTTQNDVQIYIDHILKHPTVRGQHLP